MLKMLMIYEHAKSPFLKSALLMHPLHVEVAPTDTQKATYFVSAASIGGCKLGQSKSGHS